MKRLIPLLLFLLLCCAVQASARMNPYIAGSVASAAPSCSNPKASAGPPITYTCTGFDVCQNAEAFDNTDCSTSDGGDNSETWTCTKGTGATVNLAYTTSPMRGANMIQITGGTTATDYGIAVSPAFTQTGATIYFHMLVKSVTTTASRQLAYIYHSGAGILCTYTTQIDGKLRVNSYGGTNADTVSSMSDNTAYHVWGSYTKGTGADAICTAEFTAIGSDSPTGTGNQYAASTNGNHNDVAATNIALVTAVAEITYYDQILVDNSAITNVCEASDD